MHLDRRFLIVVGCSLLWAFLVAALFYRVASNGSRPHAAPGKPLIVASQLLPFGSVIGPDSVKIIQVPEALFPKGGFSRKEEVLERTVVSAIEPDEPVVEVRIAAKGSGVGLAPMIPAGLRAIAVRVNDVVGVAGFVLPGMRVDILVTGHPPGGSDTVTTTVLQNIPVLSAGQTIQADIQGKPISATVVTLLVAPSQAEALTLANTEGHIQLVLRNNNDQEVTRTPGRQARDLYAVESHAAPVVAPPAAPDRPRPRTIFAPIQSQAAASAPVVRPAAVRPEDVILIRGNQRTIEPALPRMEVK